MGKQESSKQSLLFRSHDLKLGYFYEARIHESGQRYLYVYKNRADRLGDPVFETGALIHSAFHSPDEKYFVVHHGSASYGNVPVIFQKAIPNSLPYISEREYRVIVENGLKQIYPQFSSGCVCHLYAPIRDIRDGEALLYASGDFVSLQDKGGFGQKAFEGVFLALNLESKTIRSLEKAQGLQSWYRGRRDNTASYGSGFFISGRLIITNAHVAGSATQVAVALGNREARANVIYISKDYDLALLEVAENSLESTPLTIAKQFNLGQRVRVFGYPLPMYQGYTLKVTEGIISGLFGLMDDPLQFQITAPIQPGNSGGAILNEKNQLVGVAVSTLNKISIAQSTGSIPENVNFGIHLDIVRRFLQEKQISITKTDSKKTIFDPERSCVQVIVHG